MVNFFDDDDDEVLSSCDVVPLITCVDGNYSVDAETLAWISQRKSGFGIVACAGRYRTGKSFLLNRLAEIPSKKGFGVGNSVQACTKGLWVYKRWFPTSDPDKDVLFIDTEGIDALDANDTHDVRIFTLALLLSSAFLYNSVGAIDETAMQTLALMTRVTNNVKVHSETEETTALGEHMPSFFWVLRDFSLRLVDKNGSVLTPDEYLEEALVTSDPQKDSVRASIRSGFPRRTLVTLPRPSNDDMSDLERRLHTVSPKFKTAMDEFRKRLCDEIRPVTCNGVVATGAMYATLCHHLAGVVQTDAVPVMRDSWSLMAAVQAKDVSAACMERFYTRLQQQPCQPEAEVRTALDNLYNEEIARFDNEIMQPDAEARSALWDAMVRRGEEMMPKLIRDVADDANAILIGMAADVLADPQHASRSIERAGKEFASKFSSCPHAARTWESRIGTHAIAWVEELGATINDLQANCQARLDECSVLNAELEAAQGAPAAMKLREEELCQTIRGCESTVADALSRGMRAECETAILARECQQIDHLIATMASSCREEVTVTTDEDTERLHTLLAKVSAELQEERAALIEHQEKRVELEEKLESSSRLHKTLEASWEIGLQTLRADEQKSRNEFKEKLRIAEERSSRLEHEVATLDKSLAEEQKRASTATDMHNIEKEQLRLTAQSHKDQCEAAQNRVLEIHQSMLKNLRERDDQIRATQQALIKDRCELQMELGQKKETLQTVQKRLLESEGNDRELKRLRIQMQSNELARTRLEGENDQLRNAQAAFLEERERLRKENMQMEGELAILRANKQLNDARRDFANETGARVS